MIGQQCHCGFASKIYHDLRAVSQGRSVQEDGIEQEIDHPCVPHPIWGAEEGSVSRWSTGTGVGYEPGGAEHELLARGELNRRKRSRRQRTANHENGKSGTARQRDGFQGRDLNEGIRRFAHGTAHARRFGGQRHSPMGVGHPFGGEMLRTCHNARQQKEEKEDASHALISCRMVR